MRHWNRQAAVKWVHTAKLTQSWCGKWKPQCQNCSHPCLKSQLGVIILEVEFQSQPCLTIYYTHDETLEQAKYCEMGAHIQTDPILVWKVGSPEQYCSNPWIKSQLGVIILEVEFQSQPCLTIYHTHDSWWDIVLDKLLWNGCTHPTTHPILVWKVWTSMLKLSTTMTQQSAWGDHFRCWFPISIFFSPCIILMMRYLNGQAAVKWMSTANNPLNLAVESGDLNVNIDPTHDSKVSLGLSFHSRCWILISTLSHHLSYLWWDTYKQACCCEMDANIHRILVCNCW